MPTLFRIRRLRSRLYLVIDKVKGTGGDKRDIELCMMMSLSTINRLTRVSFDTCYGGTRDTFPARVNYFFAAPKVWQIGIMIWLVCYFCDI